MHNWALIHTHTAKIEQPYTSCPALFLLSAYQLEPTKSLCPWLPNIRVTHTTHTNTTLAIYFMVVAVHQEPDGSRQLHFDQIISALGPIPGPITSLPNITQITIRLCGCMQSVPLQSHKVTVILWPSVFSCRPCVRLITPELLLCIKVQSACTVSVLSVDASAQRKTQNAWVWFRAGNLLVIFTGTL